MVAIVEEQPNRLQRYLWKLLPHSPAERMTRNDNDLTAASASDLARMDTALVRYLLRQYHHVVVP